MQRKKLLTSQFTLEHAHISWPLPRSLLDSCPVDSPIHHRCNHYSLSHKPTVHPAGSFTAHTHTQPARVVFSFFFLGERTNQFHAWETETLVIFVKKRAPKCTHGKSVYILLYVNGTSQHICHSIRLAPLFNYRKSLS